MFAQFLDIIFKSIKLDKNLYKNPKYFGEAAIYFAGLIMILDGIAGAVAANTIVKASGIIFLSFLIIAFLSIAFIMSRMNALPVSNIS